MTILVNGTEADTVPVFDRGLQYGDGVFETIAVSAGFPLLLDEHLQRLHAGTARLRLPAADPEVLRREVNALAADVGECVIKIILTAGEGGRGYLRPESPACRRIVSTSPLPPHPPERWSAGVCVRVCETRLAVQPALAGIKHCNRLEQVLARAEWSDPAIAEGLVLDTAGNLVEGTMSNVFAVQGGIVRTPSLTGSGVRGVMRDAVMDLAATAGFPVEEVDGPLDDWLGADALFLTNSVIGIWPVSQVEDRQYGIDDVTRTLLNRLAGARLAPLPPGVFRR